MVAVSWVLVLTVFYFGNNAAVATQAGFSKEACVAAAEFWEARVRKTEGWHANAFALCVDSGAAR